MERKDHIDLFGGSSLDIRYVDGLKPSGDQDCQRWYTTCLSGRVTFAVCLLCGMGLGPLVRQEDQRY